MKIETKKLILAGGSGFLGGALVKYFRALDWEIVVLTRSPKLRADGVREIAWNARTVGDWARELEGSDVVVNLAGKSVDCRYTEKNRREIIESRVASTRAIGEAVSRCAKPPRAWFNASSATIYLHSFGTPMDESGEQGSTPEAKDEFSIDVIRQWEEAFNARYGEGNRVTRKVALRTTMVLGHAKNSVFPVLRRLARFGLGGRMGSGRQYVSWMHELDFCRAVEWLIAREDISGPVNFAAPNPLPNVEMMRLFRKTCGVPFGLPADEWMLEVGAFFLRTQTELILKSRRVVPGKLLASGFRFQFPEMRAALEDLQAKSPLKT